jgi:hypothetical protein
MLIIEYVSKEFPMPPPIAALATLSGATVQWRRCGHPSSTETRDRTMRPFITATGIAFGLLAVWAVLVQFVA